MARGNAAPALWLVDEGVGETKLSFAELSERSNRIAVRCAGSACGAAIASWSCSATSSIVECMLAAMKLGAVIVPATTLLTKNDLADRFARAASRVIASGNAAGKFADRRGITRALR